MSEILGPQEVTKPNTLIIEGVEVVTDFDPNAQDPSEINGQRLPTRTIIGADGTGKIGFVEGYGTLPDGAKVEIVRYGEELTLLRPPEAPAEAAVDSAEQDTTSTPQRRRVSEGIANVLRGLQRWLVQDRTETSGPDPDSAPAPGSILVVDPSGEQPNRRIITSPDHLNGGEQ